MSSDEEEASHVIVVEGIHRLGESLFLEVGMSTTGSLPLTKRPLLLLPSVFPSIRVFSNKSALFIRWPKYWSFSISLSNEYLGLISFRIDWFVLLVVKGTLKSLLQHMLAGM